MTENNTFEAKKDLLLMLISNIKRTERKKINEINKRIKALKLLEKKVFSANKEEINLLDKKVNSWFDNN